MTAWHPSMNPGELTYTWTWENYEIKPVVKGYAAEYVVHFKGAVLDNTPQCLFKCRRIAERHAEAARG